MAHALRRSIKAAVIIVSMFVGLVITAGTASAMATYCGNKGCGPYYIDYTYSGGTQVEYQFADQLEWMNDATNADARGYNQTSSYANILVGDRRAGNGMWVRATFCWIGTKCIPGTVSRGAAWPGESSWADEAGDGFFCPFDAPYETERIAWANYLSNIGWAIKNNGYASIGSTANNFASWGC